MVDEAVSAAAAAADVATNALCQNLIELQQNGIKLQISSSLIQILSVPCKHSIVSLTYSLGRNDQKTKGVIMAQAKLGDTVKVHYTGKLDSEVR